MGWVINTTSRPIYPRERPGTHCTGGWMDRRDGLDGCGKSRPTGIRSPDHPGSSESLYRLRYPEPRSKNKTFRGVKLRYIFIIATWWNVDSRLEIFKNKDNTRLNRRPEVSKHSVNEKLRNLFSLPTAVKMTIQRRMRWAHVGRTSAEYRIVAAEPDRRIVVVLTLGDSGSSL